MESNNRIITRTFVTTRSGKQEKVSFDKILERLENLAGDDLKVDPFEIAKETIKGLYNGITTKELDTLSADISANKTHTHPDYNKFASRIAVSNLHKQTTDNYFSIVELQYKGGRFSQAYYEFVKKHQKELQSYLDFNRDYKFDYFGFKTLERGYLDKLDKVILERPQHLFMRVAVQIHGLYQEKENPDEKEQLRLIKETYDGISNLYFTHASPTLFNAGSNHAQLSSCFLLYCGDDLGQIFDTIKDVGMISKWAGGIGIDISDVRAKGTLINGTGGPSDGLIPLTKVFNEVGRYVTQGGRRKGSIAVYLQPWHADVINFIELKKNTGDENLRARDLFLALWVPDLFMKRVEQGGMWSLMCPKQCPGLTSCYGEEFEKLYCKYESEKKFVKQLPALKLWHSILESQLETGVPYLLSKEACNVKNNQQNLGIIKSSNLCVSGDTKILTKQGNIEIKKLQDQEVEVWNGNEWSSTTVKQTSKSSNLLKITFDNGVSLKCTPEHKFYIQENYLKSSQKEIRARDLKPEMKIIKYELPNVNDFEFNNKLEHPYTQGFHTGDGTYYKPYERKDGSSNGNLKPVIALYGEKQKLIPYLNIKSLGMQQENRIACRLNSLERNKFFVPIDYNLNTRLRWLEGLVDADGCIAKNGQNESIQISSVNHEFLTDIYFMLITMGIYCKISKMHDANERLLPDGKKGYKYYNCQTCYRLLIGSMQVYNLIQLGFNPKRLLLSGKKPNRKANHFIKVKTIESVDEPEATYCFNEPLRHRGVFNGILTGQCSEIIQYTDEKEIAVCNLASICLPMFVENNDINYEKLRNVSRILVRNLDKIIDMNYYPVPEAEYSNKRHRPMGIGVQGLSDVYRKLKLPFESEEARKINKLIFENIYFGCVSESIELAKKYGKYSTFEGSPFSQGKPQWALWGLTQENLSLDWSQVVSDLCLYGTRNSLLTALMPTATTSQIMGNTEAFEQVTSNYYVRQTLAGEYTIINEQLVRDLMERGLWSQEIYEEIIYDNGSVQNIKELPQDLKELYKTAFEIKQSSIIKQAQERGPFIDQTQSMNLFFASPDFKKLASCHFASWKAGLKTWSYYLRSRPVSDPTKFGLDISAVQRIKEKRSMVSSPLESSLVSSLASVELSSESSTESTIKNQAVSNTETPEMICYRNKDANGGVCEMCSS